MLNMNNVVAKFHRAVRERNEQLVRKLLEDSELDPNEPDLENHGRPALMEAVYHGDVTIVKMLMENGVDLNRSNAQGETALHFSLHPQSFSKELVELLLDNAINVDAQEKFNGFSPLHIAAKVSVSTSNRKLRNEMLDILKTLSLRADINLKSKRKETALHRLVCGSVDWVEPLHALVTAGINVNVQNERGETALMLAVDRGHLKMAETLVKCGSNLNLKDKHFQTPLHYCAQKDNLKLLMLLLRDSMCDVNSADLNGDTALHIAASKGLVSMVRVLVSHIGVHLNVRNLRGMAPLHNAVESGFTKVVEILLDADCEVDGEDEGLLTAVSVADEEFVRRFHPEICSMIQDALDQKKDWETSL